MGSYNVYGPVSLVGSFSSISLQDVNLAGGEGDGLGVEEVGTTVVDDGLTTEEVVGGTAVDADGPLYS